MNKFDKFMHAFSERAYTPSDKQLLSIFELHRYEIGVHFNCCLPENCPWAKYEGPPLEFFGPRFHKGFRQMDILPTAQEDSEVWLLLSEGADAFWEAAESVLKPQPAS